MNSTQAASGKAHEGGFLTEVEALRGLAAFAVVITHCFVNLHAPQYGMFQQYPDNYTFIHWLLHVVVGGQSAVILFFVLSGFVLARQLEGMHGTPPLRWLGSYFVRRLFRIVPATWVAVVLAFGVAVWLHPEPEYTLDLLWRSLTFRDWRLDPPLWSLSIEMVCSLFFPLLYLANRRLPSVVRLLLLLPLAALIFTPDISTTSSLKYMVFFQVGILVGTHGPAAIAALAPWRRRVMFLLAWALYGLAPQLWPFDDHFFKVFDDRYYLFLEMPACFFILAYVVNGGDRLLGAALRSAPARFIGRISFSLYVLHDILAMNLWPIYAQAHELEFLWPYPFLMQGVFFLIVLAVSLPAASLCYHWVEVPYSLIGRRLGRRIQGLAPDFARQ